MSSGGRVMGRNGNERKEYHVWMLRNGASRLLVAGAPLSAWFLSPLPPTSLLPAGEACARAACWR